MAELLGWEGGHIRGLRRVYDLSDVDELVCAGIEAST
jgi:hypothetical protein